MDKKGVENKRWFPDILYQKEGEKPWKRERRRVNSTRDKKKN